MDREMVTMTNEEMFSAIMGRMDAVESGIATLTERMDAVENGITTLTERMDAVESGITGLTERMDTLEENINMEFWAVRTEMDGLYKSLRQDIVILNHKADRLMFSKDVEGYDRMKVRVDVLEKGYQDLRVKIG